MKRKKIIYKLKEKYQNKKVLVVGLGLQGGGEGVARFFSRLKAKVIVTDKKEKKDLISSIKKLEKYPIEYHLGGHQLKDFLTADLIIKGPSVPWQLPEIQKALENNVPVDMEISFFAQYFPGKIIGITGTRGKSTTTNLIFNLLKENGLPVHLAGNLPGISTISYLENLSEKDYVVAELSSWSLSSFHRKKISPHIAVFTNFYPDHLNYYQNMDEYFYDKMAIFLYQKKEDYLVINKNLKKIFFKKLKSLKINHQGRKIWFDKDDFVKKLKYLKGDHNRENAAASFFVGKIFKIKENKIISSLVNFSGLPFRQQIVGKKKNVFFINDSTSTTPISTIKAIEAFSHKNIILILGGNSKKLPFVELIRKLNLVKKIILLKGSFTDEILPFLKKLPQKKLSSLIYDDLEKAVICAFEEAKKYSSSVVLFSPGATSFSLFNNEFHRAETFNQIVKKIINEKT